MIDSHIHLLPGIDDGAGNIDVSDVMINIAMEDGVEVIICTPHDLNGVYRNNRTKILSATDELKRYVEDKALPVRLYPGAELHMDPDLVSKVLDGDALTLADQGKHVLVEFPKIFVARHVESILEKLLFNSITPVIAHPERNPVFIKNQQIFCEWLSWGCKAQLTAMSITGEFGKTLQSLSKDWCQQGLIHIIASDAHRPTGRAPKLAAANALIEDWMGAQAAEILFIGNPQRIIDGDELLNVMVNPEVNVKKTEKRRWYKVFSPW